MSAVSQSMPGSRTSSDSTCNSHNNLGNNCTSSTRMQPQEAQRSEEASAACAAAAAAAAGPAAAGATLAPPLASRATASLNASCVLVEYNAPPRCAALPPGS